VAGFFLVKGKEQIEGDDQKVARPTGGIEEFEMADGGWHFLSPLLLGEKGVRGMRESFSR
jgi:hypothetical protein